MKNKLLKNPTHVAQTGYNPFTLHRSVDRSDTLGMLTPCYSAWLKAGDKIDASVSIRTRTLPLLAPASASLHQCVDWFFVPANQILQQFGNWLENIRDEKSDFYATLTANNSPQNLPSFCPWDLIKVLDQDFTATDGREEDAQDSLRLADCLGIPVATMIQEWNATQGNFNLSQIAINRENVFFPAAYQKIYFDFYRLSDREANNPSFYNFDSYMASSNSPTAVNAISNQRLESLFTLHYVPYRKDYFNQLFISPIQGQKDLSSYGINPASVNQWLTGLSRFEGAVPSTSFPTLSGGGGVQTSDTNPTTIKMPSVYNSTAATLDSVSKLSTGIFNAPNISALFAVQKMLEISRRAGKHFDVQTLAHYGVNVPTGISGEVMHLGHYEQPFIIGDVISTAETQGSPLGEMAGKGYSSGSMKTPVRFTAPYHGVLMAIHYVIPDVVYSQTGFEKEHTYITPNDWPRPELDSLGMQPLFGYESAPQGVSPTAVLGWQYRYQELKMKYNVCYGAVHPDGALHYWALSRIAPFDNKLSDFLVPPTYLNDIMVDQFYYDSGFATSTQIGSTDYYNKLDYNRLYAHDPLITHFEFNVKKSSKMSTYGLLPL